MMTTMASTRSFSINQITITDSEDDDFGDIEEVTIPPEAMVMEDEYLSPASQRVRWAGNALLGYLVVAGVLCATGSAFGIRKREQDEFEADFATAAQTVADAVPKDLQRMQHSMKLFALDLQESSRNLGLTWPYVTLSSFEQKANTLNQLLGTEQLTLLPVVRNETAWVYYALEHGYWYDLSILNQP